MSFVRRAFAASALLVLAGSAVPAVAQQEGGTLVINSQTGQWGTSYDESQDFARIEMNREELPEVVERFTIAVEETDGGGVLSLTWDRARYSVPFTVR